MRKKIFIGGVLALVVTLAWCYHGRLFGDDEEKIREMVELMRVAAEAKSAAGMMEHFSRNYTDRNDYNKFMIRQMVERSLKSVDEIRVTVKDVDVLVTGERAWATVTVVAEATKKGKVYFPFGSDDRPEKPRLTLERTSTGDWLIIKVENVNNDGF